MQSFAVTYELPKRIISDRGTTFTADCFQKYCAENGIHHHTVAVRHRRANGQVKRVNATLISTIMTGMQTEGTWDKNISQTEFHLNTVVNQTTGISPFFPVYGYHAVIQDGLLDSINNRKPIYQQPKEVQQQLRDRIASQQQKWKEQHATRYTTKNFERGEIVYLRRPPISTGTSTKLQPKYRGPMIVTAVCAGDTYKIADLHQNGGHL